MRVARLRISRFYNNRRNKVLIIGGSFLVGLCIPTPDFSASSASSVALARSDAEHHHTHTVVVEELTEREEASLARTKHLEDFNRFFRFGMVDMSILLLSLVAGVSLDGVIARYVGVKGYGAIVGAGAGNVIADIVAGLPEGLYSALGVGAGAIVPLVPLAIPMAMKRPLSRPISIAVGATSACFCAFAFIWGSRARKARGEEDATETVGNTHVHVIKDVEGDVVAELEQLKSNHKD